MCMVMVFLLIKSVKTSFQREDDRAAVNCDV